MGDLKGMNVFTPPEQIKIDQCRISIFLAGTIDMNDSIDW